MCVIREKCKECKHNPDNYLTCALFVQWFKSRQNASLKSHGRELVKNPF